MIPDQNTTPLRVPMPRAVAVIEHLIASVLLEAASPSAVPADQAETGPAPTLTFTPTPTPRPVIIGITGPVGSGKSYLASLLTSCVLSWDDYLPNYDHIPEAERDLPHHADLDRLLADLSALRQNATALVPTWSFHTHARSGERKLDPKPVVVCEGLHALHPHIAALIDISVFVEADSLARWARWEYNELTGVRGWGVEKAKAFFTSVADPTFALYAEQYRSRADLIVTNNDFRPPPPAPHEPV